VQVRRRWPAGPMLSLSPFQISYPERAAFGKIAWVGFSTSFAMIVDMLEPVTRN
jgi:hypothetical protein